MVEHHASRPSYQDALRVIGRHLDLEPAYELHIEENDRGFTVRAYRSAISKEAVTTEFSWDRLKDLVVYHMAGRGCLRRRHRHGGIWADFPNGHEDFFRALGHTLDSRHGSNLEVREVAEGIQVRYTTPETEGPGGQRVEEVMHRAEVESIIRAAQERRRTGTTAGS